MTITQSTKVELTVLVLILGAFASNVWQLRMIDSKIAGVSERVARIEANYVRHE